jgi:L-2-hydroxyglutarate oxidase
MRTGGDVQGERGEEQLELFVRPAAEHLVRPLIYPVPDPSFPFLGVHFTRMIDGGIEAGPNAVLAFAREGYSPLSINPRDGVEVMAVTKSA